MHSFTQIKRAWPHLAIVLAAAIGWLLGSPQYGLSRDDHIDANITADAIEMLYAEEFTQLSALHSAGGEAEKTRLRSQLDAAFGADDTVVEAKIQIQRQRVPLEYHYSYSVAPGADMKCLRRTLEQHRAGLMRCELESSESTWDVLEYTRAIERRENTWVLAILKLDYDLLRRRLR